MFGLEKYKDIFGKPGEGAHAIRVCNIAVVDVGMTFLGAHLIQSYFTPDLPYWQVAGGLFLTGIALHRLFGVRTTVDKFLFPDAE